MVQFVGPPYGGVFAAAALRLLSAGNARRGTMVGWYRLTL